MNRCLRFFSLIIVLILSHSVFGSELSVDVLEDAPTGSSNYLALLPREIMQNHILPHMLDPKLVPYFQASVVPECYGNRKMYVYNPWNRTYTLSELQDFVYHYKILRSIDKCINTVVSSYCAYYRVLGYFIPRHIEKGCIEPIKAFLNGGGDINMQFERPSSGFVDTLLSRAVYIAGNAYQNIAWDTRYRRFCDAGLIVKVRNNYTTYVGCIKVINYLFEKNPPIDYEIEGNHSVLHIAVKASDDVFLLKLLLLQGPSFKKRSLGPNPYESSEKTI